MVVVFGCCVGVVVRVLLAALLGIVQSVVGDFVTAGGSVFVEIFVVGSAGQLGFFDDAGGRPA